MGRFDEEFWRQEVRQGRQFPSHSDLFMQHYRASNRPDDVKRVVQIYAKAKLHIAGQANGMLSHHWLEELHQDYLDAGMRAKARWYGRELIGIDRWYPSSKRCFDCGYTMPKMPLSVREWVCPECGSIHDRDINAARNVLAAGLAVSAHGEAVSPVCM